VQERNKLIIQRFNREFLAGGDESVFHDTVADDFINRTPQDPADAGPSAALYFFTKVLRVAFPDLVVTVNDQVAEGDEVVTRKWLQATHLAPFMGIAATGRRVGFGVIDIIRLRDGKYVEHWSISDMAGLQRQLTAP
jgi:predicted ester cyclase